MYKMSVIGHFFLLFNLADRPRKKIITKLNDFILVFYIPGLSAKNDA
jgi:hypothetical protein